jgi:hypothetical protein
MLSGNFELEKKPNYSENVKPFLMILKNEIFSFMYPAFLLVLEGTSTDNTCR